MWAPANGSGRRCISWLAAGTMVTAPRSIMPSPKVSSSAVRCGWPIARRNTPRSSNAPNTNIPATAAPAAAIKGQPRPSCT